MAEKNTSNGKGSDPRNCMSDNFKENFDLIKWDTKLGNKKDIEVGDQPLTQRIMKKKPRAVA